jgi:hypothetical protein
MVRAVVEKNAETLRIQVVLLGNRHGKIGTEQAWAESKGQEHTH